MAPQHWTTDQDYVDLFDFLIEKSKNGKSPLCIQQLAKEFKECSGAPQTLNSLRHRIRRLRRDIHEMEEVDTDTRKKLLFALRAPNQTVSDVNETLEREKEMIVPKGHAALEKANKRMMEFLAEKAIKVNSPIDDFAIVQEFKTVTGSPEHINYLITRYKFLKNRIYTTEFDEKTKALMMLMSTGFAPNSFLETLRKNALVEVDERNRIIKYQQNDGSFKLTEHFPVEKEGSFSFSDGSEIPEELFEVKLEPVDEEFLPDRENQELQKPKREESDFIIPKLEELEEEEFQQSSNLRGSLKRPWPFSNDFETPVELVEVKLEPVDEKSISDQSLLNPIDQELYEPKREEYDFVIPKLEELEEEDIKPELFC